MNITELKLKLSELGVRDDAYCLTGGLPNEAHTLNKVNENEWEMYYSERGSKSGKKTFFTEEEACRYFFDQIISDSVVMKTLK